MMKLIVVYFKDKFYIFFGVLYSVLYLFYIGISFLKVGKLIYKIYIYVFLVLIVGGDFFWYGDLIDKMCDCVGK